MAYMEGSERLSRGKLEPYIIVDSELLETVRKSSRLLSTKGGLKLYCYEESCSFETTKINTLRKHMMMHLGRVPYMCILCEEHFDCGDKATLHFKRAHIRQELKKLLKKYFPQTYKCGNKCGMVYKTRSAYQVHRFHSHIKDISHECKVCGLVNSCIAELRKHMKRIHKTESYICNECGIPFNSYAGHWHHIQTHTEENLWNCKTCEVKCKTQGYLKTHEMQYHEPKIHICGECGKPFGRPFGLKKHMVSHNSDPDQYQFSCLICPGKQKTAFGLKDHMRRHTGERPFACKDCEQTFRTRAVLRKHARVIHQGLRPFLCQFCSFSAGEKYSVTVHLRGVHGQIIPSVKNKLSKIRGERKNCKIMTQK